MERKMNELCDTMISIYMSMVILCVTREYAEIEVQCSIMIGSSSGLEDQIRRGLVRVLQSYRLP